MSRIFLLRHAKAAVALPGMRDFDRPLERSGRSDAEAVGRIMLARDLLPETVLCSAAKRTRETWDIVSAGWPDTEVDFLEPLFSGDAATYLDAARSAKGGSVMLVGHNPMTEALAFALLAPGAAAGGRLGAGFPTTGLAVIDFDGELADVEPGAGRLAAFVSPKNL